MSGHKGLDKWFKQDWVDIGSKKKGGGFAKCGRSKQKKDAKRKRGEKMRKKGSKGAPTAANFKRAAQTARKNT